MKKSLFARVFLLSLSSGASFLAMAQTHGSSAMVNPVKVGSVTINLGVGVGGNYRGDNYGTAFGIKAAAEFGLWQAGPGVITLGPEIGGSFSHAGYYYGDDYKSSTFVIAGRGAWHFGWDVPGLDTYAGFSAGVGFHGYHYHNPDVDYNEVIPVFGGFVGASYFVTPGFGFNAEAGYDITNFQVGVIFKLN